MRFQHIITSLLVLLFIFLRRRPTHASSSSLSMSSILNARGGGGGGGGEIGETGKTKKKKKKKKKSGVDGTEVTTKKRKRRDENDGSKKINAAMKGTDSAAALGDAIRDRKEMLQSEETDEIDSTLASLGLSLGTSSSSSSSALPDTGGGVEPSRSSILSNYFFHSHGGAYAFQSLCSFLSVLSALSFFSFFGNNTNKQRLIKRCLQCALAKHCSGLLTAALLSSKQIPKLGLYKTRQRMTRLASRDPVAQYLCYCSLLLIWMTFDTTANNELWYWKKPLLIWIIVGPVLMREVIHLGWVICDVTLILGGEHNPLLKMATTCVNAIWSILFGAKQWRDADLYQKQKLLAKLVSKCNLGMELLVGMILCLDGLKSMMEYFAAAATTATAIDGTTRPTVMNVMKRLICARLYIHFLVVRRTKIDDLVNSVRGGAKYVPVRVLDVLLEPKKMMGLEMVKQQTEEEEEEGWMSVVADALAL